MPEVGTLAGVEEAVAPRMDVPGEDAVLVRRLVDSDADALDEVYRRHGKVCYAIARRVTANVTLAEDCVQEAFLGLWRRPQAFDPAAGSLRSWLVAMTHHKAVDVVRRESAQQRRQIAESALAATATPTDPEDSAWRALRAGQVRTALVELPEPQREALGLAYYGGYTQREIAAITGVPLGTVKTRMLAGMRRLRDALSPGTDIDGSP